MGYPRPLSCLLLLAAATGCGGGSTPTGPAPSPTPLGITETATFTGAANPSCQGGGHTFQAAEGTVTLTLVETTDGVGLYGQVCDAVTGDNNACTVNQTRMNVGETLSGPRRGSGSQVVKMLTLNCGPGPTPPAPVQYTIRLTYQR
jgi:hypothetical protein